MLFFSAVSNHNGNTAVVISPDTPGATGVPEHMFINDHLQRTQRESLVAALQCKRLEWLHLLLNA